MDRQLCIGAAVERAHNGSVEAVNVFDPPNVSSAAPRVSLGDVQRKTRHRDKNRMDSKSGMPQWKGKERKKHQQRWQQ